MLEALEKVEAYQAPVYISMVFCREWVYVFLMRSGDYTEEQKTRLHTLSMEKPGVQELCKCANAEEIVDMLARVPQVLSKAAGGIVG